jgi:hypothetical protein
MSVPCTDDLAMLLALYLISTVTGALTILLSLIWLYQQRITLDQVVKSDPPGEAIKAQILNLIKISSNVPAISLFVIGLILIITPMFICPKGEKKYSMRGTVTKADGLFSRDIDVLTKFPPSIVSDDGEIGNVEVWADLDGKLPTLYFVTSQYGVKWVDLNDTNKAEILNEYIRLKEKVVLWRYQKRSERLFGVGQS